MDEEEGGEVVRECGRIEERKKKGGGEEEEEKEEGEGVEVDYLSFSSFHTIFLYPSILYHSNPSSPSILLTDGSFNSSSRINSILSF